MIVDKKVDRAVALDRASASCEYVVGTWSNVFLLAIMSSPPVATAMPAPRTAQPSVNVERLKGMLKQTIRVSVTDGRVFLGTFAGTDKQLNLLLINADEYRLGPDAGPEGLEARYVGQIMVPWRLVVRVEGKLGGSQTQGRPSDSDDESMYT